MTPKKTSNFALVIIFLITFQNKILAQKDSITTVLQNPISVDYLKQHLSKEGPKLVLSKQNEGNLRNKIKTDSVVKNMYEAIQLNASKILEEPLLTRKMEGQRLLYVSWDMLYRMNMLGMVYRIDKDPVILKRINEEVLAVCNFSDWNPSHFLDVSEMSLAVSFAIDWTDGDLPESTIKLAKTSLIQKGILPSFEKTEGNWWLDSSSNWNPVCNAGLVAASIVIAKDNPELAAKTIHRALNILPIALHEYAPDGAYPEGSTYWRYGTGYSVILASMFESSFGTDFGISKFPGFMESACFRTMCNAPSGWFYNFADCGDKRVRNGDTILAWFAAKTGNKLLYEKERYLMDPKDMYYPLYRNEAAGLVWLAQYQEKNENKFATSWKGDGANPIVIFSDKNDTKHHYYFGGKGGGAYVNHGNMDAGSFVFELNGVRWIIDPGVQSYYELEKTGFQLWRTCQDCERWTLLTKNNFGHSTITINNQKHWVDSKAEIIDFKNGNKPEATIDLTPTFHGLVESAQRKFLKDSPTSLVIEDEILVNDKTETITWQLMTTADVEIIKGGAILKQDGKKLHLKNISHPKKEIQIVALDPPPLKLDKHMDGLKRLEIIISTATIKSKTVKIKVQLFEKS